MASKRFKGKRCIYCGTGVSTEGDHVFAREFFRPEDRDRLPQVPACRACNDAKSRLEHYATAVLPFGASHPGADENLRTAVPPRLAKNRPLHQQLREGQSREPSGNFRGVPVDADALTALFALVGRGLLFHHWGTVLEADQTVAVSFFTDAGERWFDRQCFQPAGGPEVRVELGQGTVVYEGVHVAENPGYSAWRIRFYGGLSFEEHVVGESGGRCIGVLTGPREATAGPVST